MIPSSNNNLAVMALEAEATEVVLLVWLEEHTRGLPMELRFVCVQGKDLIFRKLHSLLSSCPPHEEAIRNAHTEMNGPDCSQHYVVPSRQLRREREAGFPHTKLSSTLMVSYHCALLYSGGLTRTRPPGSF